MSIALSYSRWTDADCPHRFNVLHIEKSYKEPKSEPMIIGSAVHKLTEEYRRHCYREGITSDLAWLEKKMDGTGGKIAELMANFAQSNAVHLPRDVTWVQIEARYVYGDDLMLLDRDGWFSQAARFRMVLDFAYEQAGTLYLVDDKTERSEPDHLQLELYAHLAHLAYRAEHAGRKVDRIVCVFNELAKRTIDSWEYAPEDVEHVQDLIKERLALVNSWTEYPATACSKCKWCSVPGCTVRDSVETAIITAPSTPVATIPTALTSREEAEQAALFVLFGESLTDKVKALLRTYVEEHGPVTAGGKTAELRENNPWKCKDIERTIRTLLSYGADTKSIWDNLSLPESAIQKIAKKSGIQDRLPMILKTMGERKEYKPRFGLYNDTV